MKKTVEKIEVKAFAKLNLALHVIGKLPSGYHLLDSLVAFPNIGDRLILESAQGVSLKITGPFKGNLSEKKLISGKNLILKAVDLMHRPGCGVAIQLEKNLPVSSGIGGGSSDAAATLCALSKLWSRPLPSKLDILTLGADVPVCLSDNFQRMQGIGDLVTLLPFPPCSWVVMANVGEEIKTSEIFRSLDNFENSPLERLCDLTDQKRFFDYLLRQRNDLEATTCRLYPKVTKLLSLIETTKNCLLARMSGSGGTCFGLYKNEIDATLAASKIRQSSSKYWVEKGGLFLNNPRYNEISQII